MTSYVPAFVGQLEASVLQACVVEPGATRTNAFADARPWLGEASTLTFSDPGETPAPTSTLQARPFQPIHRWSAGTGALGHFGSTVQSVVAFEAEPRGEAAGPEPEPQATRNMLESPRTRCLLRIAAHAPHAPASQAQDAAAAEVVSMRAAHDALIVARVVGVGVGVAPMGDRKSVV